MLISLRFSHKTQVCFATFSLMEIPGQAGKTIKARDATDCLQTVMSEPSVMREAQ